MKYVLFLSILALRLSYQPSAANKTPLPFASPVPVAEASSFPARLIEFNGTINNNKVMLNWVVTENETADQFEIEKSTDGVNFTLAALVFGTDKPVKENYAFYEKAGNRKVMYRIKLIDKNKKAAYSPVVEINPAA